VVGFMVFSISDALQKRYRLTYECTAKKGSPGEIRAEASYDLWLLPTAARRLLLKQPPLVTTYH